MMTWVLVVYIVGFQTSAVSTVPTSFKTEAKCEAAGKAWAAKPVVGRVPGYTCLPADPRVD